MIISAVPDVLLRTLYHDRSAALQCHDQARVSHVPRTLCNGSYFATRTVTANAAPNSALFSSRLQFPTLNVSASCKPFMQGQPGYKTGAIGAGCQEVFWSASAQPCGVVRITDFISFNQKAACEGVLEPSKSSHSRDNAETATLE